MSEEKKIINDEALENVDGGFVFPRPSDSACDDDPSLIRIAQYNSDDGAI